MVYNEEPVALKRAAGICAMPKGYVWKEHKGMLNQEL